MSTWRDWYTRHGATIERLFGDDANVFQQFLSATSQATGVKGNVTLALKAYHQWLDGRPFQGFMPAVIKNLDRIRNDEALKGAKIQQYGAANDGDTSAIAVDRHIAMLFFNVKTPNAKQIEAAKARIRKAAERLGWEPRQIQAALWAFNQVRLGTDPAEVQSYDRILEDRADFIRDLRAKYGRGEGGGVQAGGRNDARAAEGAGPVSFSQPTTQALTPTQRTLLIQHNLSSENLLHAVRMGGIPVPSLAVVKKDAPLTTFGEITLLGDVSMATPSSTTKVFGADIYSPRYPSVEYKLSPAALRIVNKRLQPFRKEGEREAYSDDFRRADDFREHKPFKRWAADRYDTTEQAVTWQQLKEAGSELMQEAGADERIFRGFTDSGNRKYVAHTLDNVAKILKQELRGGENFNYGVGSMRAKLTPQFRSIAQIRKSKDRLMSGADFEVVKKEINDEFIALSDDLGLSLDQATEVIEDTPKMGAKRAIDRALKDYTRGGATATDEQALAVSTFVAKLRDLPTAYFEAKVLRAMQLGEFKAAVVPEDAKQPVLEALSDAGIKDVKTYKPGDDQDRASKIGSFEDLAFSQPMSIDPATRYAGVMVEQKILIEDTGQTATLRLDAGQAIADLDQRAQRMRRLLECLG